MIEKCQGSFFLIQLIAKAFLLNRLRLPSPIVRCERSLPMRVNDLRQKADTHENGCTAEACIKARSPCRPVFASVRSEANMRQD